MRRPKLLIVLAGLGVVLCATGAFVLWPRPDRITRENSERITVGMSRADAEAILGRAPDGMNHSPSAASGDANATEQAQASAYALEWVEGDDTISVRFNNPGEVTEVWFLSEVPPTQALLESFLWGAERQWRKLFPD